MSSKPQTSTQQTNSQSSSAASTGPIKQMVPLYKDVFGKTQSALGATNNQSYTGDFIAPGTAGQRQGVQSIYDAAPRLSGGADELRSMGTRVASGEFLDPNNQILQQGIAAVQDPITRQLTESVLPGVSDAMIKGGAYGGSANALLNNQAMADWERQMANTGAGMTLDWTNQRWGDVFKAPELLGAANTLDLAPGMAYGMAGDVEHNINQMDLDNAIAKFQHQQEAPWFGLDRAASIYNSPGFGHKTGQSESSSTSTYTPPAPDMATQWLQGGVGGLGTLASLSNAFGKAGGIGGAFSNIFGGLTGAMPFL